MRVTRRNFLRLSMAPIVAALPTYSYSRFLEPDWLEVHHVDLAIYKAAEDAALRILHLSDLHGHNDHALERIEKAIDLGLKTDPDIVCLTGDYITHHIYDEKRFGGILENLSIDAPVFASPGNHDGGAWAVQFGGYSDLSRIRELFKDVGITFLINDKKRVDTNGIDLSIVGLGDLWAGELEPSKVLDLERIGKRETLLVLSHNPDSKDHLKDYSWDLMLCGHTHGGQVKVPVIDYPLYVPIRDKRFSEGLHQWSGGPIYVTRGVGSLHQIRFNCRPQVSIIDIHFKTGQPSFHR